VPEAVLIVDKEKAAIIDFLIVGIICGVILVFCFWAGACCLVRKYLQRKSPNELEYAAKDDLVWDVHSVHDIDNRMHSTITAGSQGAMLPGSQSRVSVGSGSQTRSQQISEDRLPRSGNCVDQRDGARLARSLSLGPAAASLEPRILDSSPTQSFDTTTRSVAPRSNSNPAESPRSNLSPTRLPSLRSVGSQQTDGARLPRGLSRSPSIVSIGSRSPTRFQQIGDDRLPSSGSRLEHRNGARLPRSQSHSPSAVPVERNMSSSVFSS
jgi:hypothetical protein